MSWRNNLEEVLVVESKDLLGNALDPGVDQVEAVLARVNVPDNAVVHVDEGVLGLLHRSQHAVEQFHRVHLV